MADIIYQEDDRDLFRPKADLVELPSGARQKRGRILSEPVQGKSYMMSEGKVGEGLRLRKGKGSPEEFKADQNNLEQPKKDQINLHKVADENRTAFGFLLSGGNTVLGIVVMIFLAYKYSMYLYQLHDNELWFSEILELEREISFRTEQGLYYSYYKQLLDSPSIAEGMKDLQVDNKTESGKTINILHRFNIYQEVFLAYVYKIYSFRLQPIFFYTYSIFALQGFYLSSLYLISWGLSGTWLSGVLTSVFVVINRFDVTRVTFTVPLREHFSLPFIFAQFGSVGQYLKAPPGQDEMWHLVKIYALSFMFTVTWQFAQFTLLLQALVLFGLATVGLLDKDRVCRLLTISLLAMLTVWYLQFYQQMVINSIVVSLIPVAILSLQSQPDKTSPGVLKNLGLAIVRVIVAISLTFGINIIFKVSINQTSDNHIFKFIRNKFVKDTSDFESQLYLCNEAFKWLDVDTYQRLLSSSALPLYMLYSLLCLTSCLAALISRWSQTQGGLDPTKSSIVANGSIPGGGGGHDVPRSRSRASIYEEKVAKAVAGEEKREVKEKGWTFLVDMENRPDLTYHIGQTVPLCLLAMSTLRMKCFWSPYVCVLASVCISDHHFWSLLLSKVPAGTGSKKRLIQSIIRHLVLILVILYLGNAQKPKIDAELGDLREFYDPDTIDLMQWLQQNTKSTEAIAGSMQLMAGVKLCSGNTVTNHPHFEDKDLRDRTREIYQMYGKVSPASVHSLLTKYNTAYIILEDSICLAHRERCSTPDIIDLTNGHIPDDDIKEPAHLVYSDHPRFCDEVRYDQPEYRKWFKKVFENKTFRIYKVKKGPGSL